MDQPPDQGDKKDNLRLVVLDQTLTLLLGGLSLVAALAWNDAILSLFKRLFPETGGLIAKFVYALVVTAIIAAVSMRLRRIKERALR